MIIVGETGCGKTTQIPQFLDEAGWTQGGRMVCCTQPRRVAATSIAARVASEMGVTCGRECGYSVRFEDCTTPGVTRVRYVTDGLLVREMMRDPLLTQYSVIMVDEAHERSLQTDVLLGLLRKVLWRNRTLRLIVASATLDALAFKSFFEQPPSSTSVSSPGEPASVCIMSIEGRMHPVDVCYTAKPVEDYVVAAVDTAWQLHRAEPPGSGDILVFLPGQDEIEQAVRLLRSNSVNEPEAMPVLVLPMYAGLPYSEQEKVFRRTPRGSRKVVFATTIAETSVTIDGVAYVIDCGFTKLRCFDGETGLDALIVAPVSQAAANQRAGRAGRTCEGRCFRLYREIDFDKLQLMTVPEIQRCDLSSLVLQLKAMGIEDLAHFDFFSPPPTENVIHALELCFALGAIDSSTGRLTNPIGVQLSQLPIEPQMGKMIIHAAQHGCSEEAIKIAAMMSVQNVFVPPSSSSAGSKAVVDRAKRQFAVYEGDHMTYLNLFNEYLDSANNEEWCHEHGIRGNVMRKASHVRKQLRAYCRHVGITLNNLSHASAKGDDDSEDVNPIIRSIVAGYFANAATRNPDNTYRPLRHGHSDSNNGTKLVIHPFSVLCDLKPEWVVYTELALTSQPYMRDVTSINPSMLREIAPHFFELRQSSEATAANSSAATRLHLRETMDDEGNDSLK